MRIGSSAIDSVFTGRGESIVTSRAHGSRPLAISNPELRLPMMATRRPSYSAGGRVST